MRKEIFVTNQATVDTYGKLSIRMGEDKAKELLRIVGINHEGIGAMYNVLDEDGIHLEVSVSVVGKLVGENDV